MTEKQNFNDNISASLRDSLEIGKKIQNNITPIIEQQTGTKSFLETAVIPKIEASLSASNAVKGITENSILNAVQNSIKITNSITGTSKAIESSIGAGTTIDTLNNTSSAKSVGELAIKSAIPTYQFESTTFKAFEEWNENVAKNLITGLNTLVRSPVMQEIQSLTSNLEKWLQTVDFSPLISIIESIRIIGFDYDYKEVNKVFLKAMFDAKWFPYAGWTADCKIVDEVLVILNTSKASKNRVKRIDKLIFSYYHKDEINYLKRSWRQMNLPSYMTRILVQSVNAYHRREYALTVSALSTLWEGIIQEKANDDSYRVSKKTRENLTKLIKENKFDEIFSSFCEDFIFYDCNKPEEVKSDVPGRHGIAHCWYNTYPNRKVALNSILFTDFLLGLKPLDGAEDKE